MDDSEIGIVLMFVAVVHLLWQVHTDRVMVPSYFSSSIPSCICGCHRKKTNIIPSLLDHFCNFT